MSLYLETERYTVTRAMCVCTCICAHMNMYVYVCVCYYISSEFWGCSLWKYLIKSVTHWLMLTSSYKSFQKVWYIYTEVGQTTDMLSNIIFLNQTQGFICPGGVLYHWANTLNTGDKPSLALWVRALGTWKAKKHDVIQCAVTAACTPKLPQHLKFHQCGLVHCQTSERLWGAESV